MKIRLIPLVLLVLFVAGCAAYKEALPPVPKTPSQTLAVFEGQYTALKLTAAELADAGVLTPSRREWLAERFVTADRARDAARLAWDLGDVTDLDANLALFTLVLLELRTEVSR